MKVLKPILGMIAALIAIVCGFIWGYAPLRDERLEVKNASHFSNLDQPEEVARAINEFVKRNN